MALSLPRRAGWARCRAAVGRTLRDFAADRRGAVAMILGLAIIPLFAIIGLSIDTCRAYMTKSRLSAAVDAAALAGGRVFTSDNRDQDVQMYFDANFPDGFMGSEIEPLVITPDDINRKLTVAARVTIPTTFMRVLGEESITIAANAEVTIQSQNVEVSLVLDITGSMSGSKISDLIDAANELVDIVVQDQQDPFYSKIALVPYSMGVNVGAYASQVRGAYTNNTCTYPASPTCRYYQFRRYSDNNWTTQEISNCVSERAGAEAYTDAAPSVSRLMPNYPAPGTYNPCPPNAILPLTSDRDALHTEINSLTAGGATAGQIGIAWGWYMLSPNFGYLWPGEGEAADYDAADLAKVAIIMTDGAFNTTYYDGVIARDSGSGSGTNAYKINHDSANGSSSNQALSLCTAMKAAGIEIFAVGFDIASEPDAQALLGSCATDASHLYLPEDGTSLKSAFHSIALKVSRLRLSK
jgi:Flp pilus assembly protein TadG